MAYFPYSHWWRYRWFHWYQVCLLKFYLNSLVCDRNIFRSSSKSSAICRNFRKMFGNVRLAFATSESGRTEIFGKSSKTPSSVCLYNKKNITRYWARCAFLYGHQTGHRIFYLYFISHRMFQDVYITIYMFLGKTGSYCSYYVVADNVIQGKWVLELPLFLSHVNIIWSIEWYFSSTTQYTTLAKNH